MRKSLSIERLLQWAYADERVRGLPSRPFDDEAFDGDLSLAVAKARPALDDLPDAELGDALKIDMVVSRLSRMTRHLIRDHAIARTQPDWLPHARWRMAPASWTERGRALWLDTHPPSCRCRGLVHLCTLPASQVPAWKRGEKRNAQGDPLPPPYCPIVEVDNPADVATARAELYLRWWAGLKVLRDCVADGALPLTQHTVTADLPPLRPWDAQRKILRSNFSVDGTIAAP